MAKGNTKQRAKKKQQKREQRKKKLARREGRSVEATSLSAHHRPEDLLKGWKPEKQGILGLAQRRKITVLDALLLSDAAKQRGTPGTEGLWTLARIQALSDEAILAKLAQLGIVTDRETYLAATANDASAVPHAAAPWTRALSAATPALEVDFVYFVALELWRRWRPERPSRENLLLLHEAAWDLDLGGDEIKGLAGFLDFGDQIWIAFPNARRMNEIDAVLSDPAAKYSPFYFDAFAETVAGLASELVERGIEGAKDLAARTLTFLETIVTRLADSDATYLEMIDGARSNLLDVCGRREEGLAVLRGMIEQRPARAAGYAMLAEAVMDSDPLDKAHFEEAIAILKKGVAVTTDAEDWELQRRIEGIEHERWHLEHPGEPHDHDDEDDD